MDAISLKGQVLKGKLSNFTLILEPEKSQYFRAKRRGGSENQSRRFIGA